MEKIKEADIFFGSEGSAIRFIKILSINSKVKVYNLFGFYSDLWCVSYNGKSTGLLYEDILTYNDKDYFLKMLREKAFRNVDSIEFKNEIKSCCEEVQNKINEIVLELKRETI